MRVVKRLARHRLARGLAWLVQVALLAGMVAVAPAPAQAQETTAKLAVVLDFGNLATASPLAGDEAASALTLALVQRGFEVTPRAEVQDRLRQIGVRAPFEPDEVRLIRDDLDIRDIYSGAVVAVNEAIGAQSSVEVLLRLEAYDGETGDLINGAYGRGFEILASGDIADREAGRASAIERAINQALTTMDARQTMSAAVLSYSPPNRVLMNKGAKQGVSEGMEFNVFRTIADPENPNRTQTVKIGRVVVTSVSADDATARPIESTNQGINTRDELREIFRLPDITPAQAAAGKVPAPSQPARAGKAGSAPSRPWLAPTIGAVVGALGVAALVMIAGNSTSDAPKVTASNAYLRQSAPGANPSIEVGWGDRNYAPPKRYIGGYIVYRGVSNAFSALQHEAVGAVPGSNQRRFTDDPTWNDVNAQIPLRYERIDTDDITVVNQIMDVRIIHESPQPGRTYYYKVRRIGPPAPATAPTVFARGRVDGTSGAMDLGSRAARMRAQSRGQLLTSGGNIRITNLMPAQVIHRQVTSIPPDAGYDATLNPANDNDIPQDADIGLSDASGAIGPVTYLVPPDLQAPANNNQAQRVDDVAFSWQGVLGATEYVVQVAGDANFSSIVFSSAPIASTSSGVLSYRYNAATAGYRQLAPNSQYFWRVGVKSTFGGQRAPEPNGYVFSNVYTFQTADQPPTPPRQ